MKRISAIAVLFVGVLWLLFCAVSKAGSSSDYYRTFIDAVGLPIPNAKVEFFTVNEFGERVPCGQFQLDEQGSCPTVGLARRLVLSHPDYGVAKAFRYYYGQQARDIVYMVPLVHKDSPEASRAIRGVVLDPNNRPVPGTRMICSAAEAPSRVTLGAVRAVTVITDANGWFQMYLPLNPRAVAYEVPPSCRYRVAIKPPKKRELMPDVIDISNDEQTALVLKAGTLPRKLILEDANGPITEPEKLKGVWLWIKLPSGRKKMYFEYAELKDGRTLPSGLFEPWMSYKDHPYRFKPTEVTADSPQELHFRLIPEPQDSIVLTGEVVTGVTGRPMPGIFVIGADSTEQDLSVITTGQWNRIHELEPMVCGDELALKPLRQIRPFWAIGRTDENGRFELTARTSKLFGFVLAFEENYVAIPYYLDRERLGKLKGGSVVEVGTLKLFPAATVIIEPILKKPATRIRARWKIDPSSILDWSQNLYSEYSSARRFMQNHYLSPNQINTMHIPGDVNVQIQLEPLTSLTWDLRQWEQLLTQTIHASQGQRLNLGRFVFLPKMYIYVEVVDPVGKAVEGVAVENWTGRHQAQTYLTDANGTAEFAVSRNQSGRFTVRCPNMGLMQSIPYQTNGPEDANSVFTLQVSDELLYHLFK